MVSEKKLASTRHETAATLGFCLCPPLPDRIDGWSHRPDLISLSQWMKVVFSVPSRFGPLTTVAAIARTRHLSHRLAHSTSKPATCLPARVRGKSGGYVKDKRTLLTFDGAIPILIRLLQHLVDLLIGQILAELPHHEPQLIARNAPAVVAVKDLKRHAHLVLEVRCRELNRHHVEEF